MSPRAKLGIAFVAGGIVGVGVMLVLVGMALLWGLEEEPFQGQKLEAVVAQVKASALPAGGYCMDSLDEPRIIEPRGKRCAIGVFVGRNPAGELLYVRIAISGNRDDAYGFIYVTDLQTGSELADVTDQVAPSWWEFSDK